MGTERWGGSRTWNGPVDRPPDVVHRGLLAPPGDLRSLLVDDYVPGLQKGFEPVGSTGCYFADLQRRIGDSEAASLFFVPAGTPDRPHWRYYQQTVLHRTKVVLGGPQKRAHSDRSANRQRVDSESTAQASWRRAFHWILASSGRAKLIAQKRGSFWFASLPVDSASFRSRNEPFLS
jgi:hypothetical protein